MVLYGSETWGLWDNELTILTEIAMIRAMCGVKLIEKMISYDLYICWIWKRLDGLSRASVVHDISMF